MPTAVVDLTRLKKLHCGLGQFALHLGRAIQAESREPLRPLFLTPPGGARLLSAATTPPRTATAGWWQKEGLRGPLVRLLGRVPGSPRGDVWHTIDHLSAYGPSDDQTPVVLTVHDLNFPPQRTARQNERSLRKLQRRIDRAAVLTTGSHFAAAQIRSLVDVRGKELRVIYHGLCVRPESSAPRPAFAPEGEFLFSIGEFRPYKNFHVLIEFLGRLPGRLSLVIAGNRATPYGEQVQEQVRRAGLQERIILPGVVSDAERHWLYAHCRAFVFPSIAEGFGLPAIEGMSFGKPVFLAEATSLPEIGGPLAWYWREFEPQSMCAIFEAGLAAFSADDRYADRLRAHAAQFTWPEAVRRYLALYAEVLSSGTSGGGTSSVADEVLRRAG